MARKKPAEEQTGGAKAKPRKYQLTIRFEDSDAQLLEDLRTEADLNRQYLGPAALSLIEEALRARQKRRSET